MRLKRRVRSSSYAVAPDNSVALYKILRLDSHTLSHQSAFRAIHNNDDALAWRMALIENAEKSIDAQYYSWKSDISGQLLIHKLIEAADRGVRVRLLLDDIHTFGADRRIATLNRHPLIEVRLFNPFYIRIPVKLLRIIELLWNLNRLNNRMHNKLIIADNVISIIGGRNIGDEYFGLNKNFVFRDLDLLVTGKAVKHLSKSFDLYWNSKFSKKARRIIAFRPGRQDFVYYRDNLKQAYKAAEQVIQRIINTRTLLLSEKHIEDKFLCAPSQVCYDLPGPKQTQQSVMIQSLYTAGSNINSKLTIVSPYFVPSTQMIESFRALVNQGVDIEIYTNSLESIDVTAAFSGYQLRRKELLLASVKLFEFRSTPDIHSVYTTPAINVDRYSLHAKTIIYDCSTVYVGTLNLDPRSVSLNTEIGILVDSCALAEEIRNTVVNDVSEGQFWSVSLDTRGRIQWVCGKDHTFTQPARGVLQRLANRLYLLLPIQRHL